MLRVPKEGYASDRTVDWLCTIEGFDDKKGDFKLEEGGSPMYQCLGRVQRKYVSVTIIHFIATNHALPFVDIEILACCWDYQTNIPRLSLAAKRVSVSTKPRSRQALMKALSQK